MTRWKTALSAMRPELEALFQHLHTHPEISWQEYDTTRYLAERLTDWGFRVRRFETCTGLTADWGPDTGPTVALRTDIDALWQVVDGEWQANHSCGHDGHMTVVTGALRLLQQAFPTSPVRIRAIYQPAEETGEGARQMVELGALDDVVFLFGVHLRPKEELSSGQFSACIRNGGAIQIDGRITGTAAHGARPHLGVNAIEAAIAGWQAVQTLHFPPMIPHSVKITRLEGGGQSTNIIPDTAQFSFDLRAETNELLDQLVHQVESRVRQACAMMGAEVEFHRGSRVMAAQVDDTARRLLAEAIVDCFGEAALVPEVVTPGAEDFHYYTALRPDVKATMLGLGCNLTPGLHHPKMHFDRECLLDGAEILAEAAARAARMLGMERVSPDHSASGA
ncbi:amidohydrolase AmhX [Alicyclobacillus contaminans]|uniref:amidohydrolase n=1 Tax=Alicyclobacillus contaminans TaxID=392016 RepID=UPI00041E4730|nr:amidohydrolase [Alicyclobacillus contaminans]GMA50289.1 amidohydrolase AmhX [Alicyclobacillus contaminans]